MIRINLIQKKQASYLSSASKAADSGFKSSGSGKLAPYLPMLKNFGIPLLFGIAANFAYDYYIDQRVSEMAQEAVRYTAEKEKITKELTKIKGFDAAKVELERNELILRTKINTIEKLVRGRDFTVKSLVSLAQAMPRDIWMTEVIATETSFEFKGGTIDLGMVPDFMAKLGQNIYFKEVALKNTTADVNGKQANFDLTARRE